MEYLKPRDYYVDLYDLRTIKDCLNWYWTITDGFEKHRNDKEFSKYSKKKFDHEVNKCASYTVNALKAERYRHKASRIQEWMDRDKAVQSKYDNAVPPKGIYCSECGGDMIVESKDFLGIYEEDSQILFMFNCTKCKKNTAFYEDGKKWKYEPPKCPKCNSDLDSSRSKDEDKDVSVTVWGCTKCDYTDTSVFDFAKSREDRKKKKEKDRILLGKYRSEFCLNDENGPSYLSDFDGIINLVKEWKAKEKKEQDPVYKKAKKLKVLKLSQLKKTLQKLVENNGYEDLEFEKPDLGKYVIVSFSVSEATENREEYESKNTLKKLLLKELKVTNWRLMSNGIRSRLGILSGRLKAYEKEEDLIDLVRKS